MRLGVSDKSNDAQRLLKQGNHPTGYKIPTGSFSVMRAGFWR
jgi:hypothetical protein